MLDRTEPLDIVHKLNLVDPKLKKITEKTNIIVAEKAVKIISKLEVEVAPLGSTP